MMLNDTSHDCEHTCYVEPSELWNYHNMHEWKESPEKTQDQGKLESADKFQMAFYIFQQQQLGLNSI